MVGKGEPEKDFSVYLSTCSAESLQQSDFFQLMTLRLADCKERKIRGSSSWQGDENIKQVVYSYSSSKSGGQCAFQTSMEKWVSHMLVVGCLTVTNEFSLELFRSLSVFAASAWPHSLSLHLLDIIHMCFTDHLQLKVLIHLSCRRFINFIAHAMNPAHCTWKERHLRQLTDQNTFSV